MTEQEFVEGTAKILKEEDTFFNPAQKLNRDISAEVIKEYFKDKETVKILTSMSATGLRGIRYLNEISNSKLFFNDISQSAVETIQKNLEYNNFKEYKLFSENENLRDSKEKINITLSDCLTLMYKYHSFFDVIDIDPFGSCAEFVNAAFKAIRHNGIICFTCTDKAALCSNVSKCFVKYSTSIKKNFCNNETPIRVLLSYISREFAKYDARIVPLVSFGVDFYVRVIVRVVKSQGKRAVSDNSMVGMCDCYNFEQTTVINTNVPICKECNKPMKIFGPYWNKEMHDINFVQSMLHNIKEEENERMVGILRLISQEIPDMFFYEMPELASVLKVSCCKLKDIMNALANLGYRVSLTHCDNNSFKSNAPFEVVKRTLIEISSNPHIKITENDNVKKIFEMSFYRGKVKSGLKPLSLPKSS